MLEKLPTDNLYKFIALFGLAVFITTFHFQNKKDQDINEKILSLNRQKFELNQEIKQSKIIISELEKELKVDLKFDSNYTRNPSNVYYLKLSVDIAKSNLSKLDSSALSKLAQDELKLNLFKMYDSMKDISFKIKAEDYYLKELMKLRKKNLFSFYFFNIISAMLIGYGFSLWYYGKQRYEDAELRLKYDDLVKKKESEKLKEPAESHPQSVEQS